MKSCLWTMLLLVFLTGCRRGAQSKSDAPGSSAPRHTVQASEWHPSTTGVSYQLGLKEDIFSFCDDTGPQQVDVRTGKQSAGPQKCDRKTEAVQSSCDDDVEITGDPAQPYDVLSFEGQGYKLNGHSRGCDRDRHLVVITTASDVELIDGATNRVRLLDADVPDQIVLGSGWVAWNSLDKKVPLRLEGVAKAMTDARLVEQ